MAATPGLQVGAISNGCHTLRKLVSTQLALLSSSKPNEADYT